MHLSRKEKAMSTLEFILSLNKRYPWENTHNLTIVIKSMCKGRFMLADLILMMVLSVKKKTTRFLLWWRSIVHFLLGESTVFIMFLVETLAYCLILFFLYRSCTVMHAEVDRAVYEMQPTYIDPVVIYVMHFWLWDQVQYFFLLQGLSVRVLQ